MMIFLPSQLNVFSLSCVQKVNGNPFKINDAGFALSYAVIMLNTDQHNHNVRKQNIPMTVEVSPGHM